MVDGAMFPHQIQTLPALVLSKQKFNSKRTRMKDASRLRALKLFTRIEDT